MRKAGPTIDQVRVFSQLAHPSAPVSTSAAHHMLSRLREALGVPDSLAYRNRDGGWELTDVGQELLPLAQDFVRAADRLLEKPTAVRVSGYPSHIRQLAEPAGQFSRERACDVRYVGVGEDLRRNRGSALIDMVRSFRVDVAIAPAGHRRSDDDALHETEIYDWVLRVVLPATAKEREQDQLDLADLQKFRIAVAPSDHTSHRKLAHEAEALRINLDIDVLCENPAVIREIARNSSNTAAVIPGDSFGAADSPDIGPALVVGGQRRLGDSYSLYRLTALAGPPTPHQALVDDFVDAILTIYACSPER
jgi:DNA-binding transcriptional LysR family regulator